MNKLLTLLLLFSYTITLSAQEEIYNDDPQQRIPIGVEKPNYGKVLPTIPTKIDKVRMCPPNWWVGMEDTRLEILIYDQFIKDYTEGVAKKEGVTVKNIRTVNNPNYLFVLLEISPETKPGKFGIELGNGVDRRRYTYELLERKQDKNRVQGINSSDLIYLVMPDRFANGDPDNDSFEDMHQVGVNRDKMFFRHGGDIKGIIDKLDYLEDLGITALWINPLLENDQPYESYHGYAITDHYNIDKRFGSNADYQALVDSCHSRGIKVVMDIIHNHVGDKHWLFEDIPAINWINQHEEFTRTTYRAPTLMDPYAAQTDKLKMSNGWFDHHMPDLNQKNPHLSNFLIQNNIWWTEFSGHDGFRVDTYAYPDQKFMATWGKRLQKEYPKLGIFGETWVHGATIQSHFTQNNSISKKSNSNLPGVTDFQLYYAINDALERGQGWTEGVSKLYYTLAKDFLYEDPNRNVIFLDNHDLSRFYSMVKEDKNKFKSGIAWLMTMRGIPMMYYGTEILMKNYADPDGKVREDFPGGWEGDKVNKFTSEGRTAAENEAFEYIKKLANFRKENPVLHTGKLTQYVPEDGIYIYFRQNFEKTIMVIMNSNNKAMTVPTDRYKENIRAYRHAIDIATDEFLEDIKTIEIEKNSTLILELTKKIHTPTEKSR